MRWWHIHLTNSPLEWTNRTILGLGRLRFTTKSKLYDNAKQSKLFFLHDSLSFHFTFESLPVLHWAEQGTLAAGFVGNSQLFASMTIQCVWLFGPVKSYNNLVVYSRPSLASVGRLLCIAFKYSLLFFRNSSEIRVFGRRTLVHVGPK